MTDPTPINDRARLVRNREPNPDLIEELEHMLSLARSGHVQAYAFAYVDLTDEVNQHLIRGHCAKTYGEAARLHYALALTGAQMVSDSLYAGL